jgi:hypothetical protein
LNDLLEHLEDGDVLRIGKVSGTFYFEVSHIAGEVKIKSLSYSERKLRQSNIDLVEVTIRQLLANLKRMRNAVERRIRDSQTPEIQSVDG